jgi:hypothetical protein
MQKKRHQNFEGTLSIAAYDYVVTHVLSSFGKILSLSSSVAIGVYDENEKGGAKKTKVRYTHTHT